MPVTRKDAGRVLPPVLQPLALVALGSGAFFAWSAARPRLLAPPATIPLPTSLYFGTLARGQTAERVIVVRDVPAGLIRKASATERCGCVPVITPRFDAVARTAAFTVPLDTNMIQTEATTLLALDEKGGNATRCRLSVRVQPAPAPPRLV